MQAVLYQADTALQYFDSREVNTREPEEMDIE